MAETVADLMVRVGADISGAQAGLRNVNQSISDFGRRAAASATQAGQGLMMLGAPLAAFGALSVKAAGDFESQMNILAVAAKGGGASLEQLGQVAIKAGNDASLVGVSAVSAAEAMTLFSKAGVSTNDMLGNMQGYLSGTSAVGGAFRAAVDLAAASELDMVQASELVITTMSTFGLSADEASSAMSNYVQAADASVASVSDLAAAMANIGPTMAAFGFPLADVNNALALLSTRGIKGAEAGTALKSMFTNMMRDSKDVNQALKDLNISLYDSAGNMRSMPDILGQFSRATKGLTEEQRNAYVQTIAGTYGMKAMNTLLAECEDGWNKMAGSIDKASTMQNTAAARTKGFNAAMEQLRDAISTFMITAGTPLIKDVVTPLVKLLTRVVTALGKVNPSFLKFAAIAGVVLVALGGFLMVVGQVASSIMAIGSLIGLIAPLFAGLGGAIAAAAAAIGAALLPIILIIAAVAAVAGLLYLAWKNNFLGLKDIVEVAWDAIKGIFDALKLAFSDIMSFLRGEMTWDDLLLNLEGTWGAIKQYLGQAWHDISSIFTKNIGPLKEAAGKIWDKLIESLGPLGQFIDGIRIVFENVLGVIQDAFGRIVESVGAFWKLITGKLSWKDFIGELGGIWDTFGDVIDEAWTNILAVVNRAWEAIKVVIRAALSAIGGIILNGIAEFIAPLVGGMDNAKQIVTNAWENIKVFLSNVWEAIKTSAAAAWEALKGIVKTAIEAVRTVVAFVLSGISGDWDKAFGALGEGAKRIFNTVSTTIGNVVESIKTGMATKWEAIRAGAVEKWEAISSRISSIVTKTKEIVLGVFGELVEGAANLFGKIIAALSGKGEDKGGAGLGSLLNIVALQASITQAVTLLQQMQRDVNAIWLTMSNDLIVQWNLMESDLTQLTQLMASQAILNYRSILGGFRSLGQLMMLEVRTTWGIISSTIRTAAQATRTSVLETWTAMNADLLTWWTLMQTELFTISQMMQQTTVLNYRGILGGFRVLGQLLMLEVRTTWGIITTTVIAAAQTMRAGALGAAESMKTELIAIFNAIASAAYSSGVSIGENVADGIRDSIPAAVAAAEALAAAVAAVLPHSDAEKGPLSTLTASGRALPETLALGIGQGKSAAVSAVQALASAMDTAMPLSKPGMAAPAAPPAAPAPAAPASQVVNVTINNPRGEPSEKSMIRALKNLAAVGVLQPMGA